MITEESLHLKDCECGVNHGTGLHKPMHFINDIGRRIRVQACRCNEAKMSVDKQLSACK